MSDLATAGPTDQVYAFDPQTGAVRFGDGVHGAIPTEGVALRASYTPERKPGYVDFYREMKKADPDIDVCSSWAPIREQTGLGTASFPQLMAQHGLAHSWDCISIHPYTNFGQQAGNGGGDPDRVWETAREGHDQYMLGDAEAAALVDGLRADVHRYGRGQDVVMSEFGALWFGGQDDVSGFPHWETAMSHALYMASQWTHYSQDGLPWVMGNTLVSDPGGLRAVLGGEPTFVFTADAVVREQFAPMVDGGGRTVEASVRGNPRVQAVDPPEGATSYTALTTTAAVGRDGHLRIVVVNRDPDQTVTATMVPRAFRHAPEATITTVAGASYTSYNDQDHPDDVVIQDSSAQVGSGTFSYSFPAHAVTMITLAPQE